MKKIGIISCANTTKVLDCPLSPCLQDFYDRKGAFARYKDKNAALIGIVSCPGCLGGLAPEAFLAKAHSLVHYGAQASHLTYCMAILCPYAKRYAKMLKKRYPEIEVIPGTHEPHDSAQKTRESISRFLVQKIGSNIIP